MNPTFDSQPVTNFELRFQSLDRHGRSWSFACDAEGHVDMDAMTESVRNNYLFARALIGIDLDTPHVRSIST